jgi:hypothetical protein
MTSPIPWAPRGSGSAVAVLLALIAAPVAVRAQVPADSIAAQLSRLQTRVDSLTRELARLSAGAQPEPAEDPLAALRAAAQNAAGGPPPAQTSEPEFEGRERSLQALNPEISVTADMFGHIDQDNVRQDNFFAREFEVSFISNLDPYSRAKIFLSRESPGGNLVPFPVDEEEETASFAVEEGYIEWVGLPAGLSLKLGRFQQRLGQLNRWHSHALPFQSRSLPHIAFVGEEALAQTGASLHWLLPVGGGSGTYEATVEVTRSENTALFGDSGRPAVLGHVNGFWQLTEATDLDLGLSWVNGSYEDATEFFDRNLFAAEAAFTWRPPARARYRGVTVRGGVMALDGLVSAAQADRAIGFWSQAEVRLSEAWLAGARVDRTENPLDPNETSWLASPTLTWWQSEYVRVRLEYDLLGRSWLASNEGRALLQVTFAMGPHKHETY